MNPQDPYVPNSGSSPRSGNGSPLETEPQDRAEEAKNALRRAKGIVGERVGRMSEYVKDRRFEGIAEDVAGLVRRNPVQAVLLSVGIGYFIGRMRNR